MFVVSWECRRKNIHNLQVNYSDDVINILYINRHMCKGTQTNFSLTAAFPLCDELSSLCSNIFHFNNMTIQGHHQSHMHCNRCQYFYWTAQKLHKSTLIFQINHTHLDTRILNMQVIVWRGSANTGCSINTFLVE